jgi:hypothetical protein
MNARLLQQGYAVAKKNNIPFSVRYTHPNRRTVWMTLRGPFTGYLFLPKQAQA